MIRGTQHVFRLVLVVATSLYCCCDRTITTVAASLLTVQSMTESESSRDEKMIPTLTRNNAAAAQLLHQQTQEWMKQQHQASGSSNHRVLASSSSTSSCPVCEERRFMKEKDDEEDSGSSNNSRIGNAMGKVQDLLNTDGSVLNTVKVGIINATKTALQNNGEESVSVETLIPLLTTSANQFTIIGQNIQSTKQLYIRSSNSNNDAVSADTADLVIAIYDLLEGIVVAIADLFFSIINIISTVLTAIVQFITDIILAILGLIEGIKLGIIQIIVDFLNAITGNDGNGRRKALDLFDTSENGPIVTLRKILSSGRLGGIYSDVITSLQERNDDSGLIAVLMDSATDMEVIDDKLSVFLDSANQAIMAQDTDGASSTEVSTISEDTVVEILNLIVATISAILNLIVGIILTVLNLIVSIVLTIIDLIVSIIVGILEVIISIINAILGIFTRETGASASAQAATLLGIATTMLASPIYDVMICQLGLSSCTMPSEEIDCEVQALACENEQLAKALTA